MLANSKIVIGRCKICINQPTSEDTPEREKLCDKCGQSRFAPRPLCRERGVALVKFNAVPKHTFYLDVKESEFLFNQMQNNLYEVLLSFLRKDSL